MKRSARHLHPSDLRALAQLATLAVTGVVSITEGVHQSVLSTMGFEGGPTAGQTGGITGLVYQSVQGVTRLLGRGVDSLLLGLESALTQSSQAAPGTPLRATIVGVLNGVVGDRLVATHNPLATAMSLRYQGESLDPLELPPSVRQSDRALVLIHGLCMTDLQWPQAAPLAAAAACEPVYVLYNTGLHISQNGRELAYHLERLGGLGQVCVVAHSMGGLVLRSAFHYACQEGLSWPTRLGKVVFLGTPHHGSPLERAGNWVDALLSRTPFTAPLARLGKVRSAGITDLRFGHLVDEDWQGTDRFERRPDSRRVIPLPQGVACYAVAATLASQRSSLADRLVGDGLVPLRSALGQHDEPQRNLNFDPAAQLIAYRTSHLGLLTSTEVTRHVQNWLRQPKR
jgi:pimeloyl-ACP methyl ester carboxylesterase